MLNTPSQNELSHNWTSLYREGVEPELCVEHDDMLSAFKAVVSKSASSKALYFFSQSISYQKLDEDSDALAAWLQASKVQPGDRVAIITQNIPAFPTMMIAAWKVGAVPVPANPQYTHKELARILKDAEPSALLCESNCEEQVKLALPLAELDGLPMVLALSDNDGKQTALQGPNSLEEICLSFKEKTFSEHTFKPDDLGLILYTSGTTGTPKGAMISHKSLSFTGQFVREWFKLKPDSRMFAIAPFFHITGFVSHLCAAIVAGCSNIINYRFAPQLAVDMIKKWQATHTVGAITVFNAIMSLPDVKASDLESLEEVYSGGAPVPPALRAELKANLGLDILPVYGMTETSGPAIFSPFGQPVPEIDGQLAIGIPIPSTDISIADNDGKPLARGEVGEIYIKGPQVMQAYWRNPDETANTLVEGWLHSGDVGFMDEQGWVYLVDRKKDVIIASGFKVWPREVEDVLYEHSCIREAAVVGIADDYRGENVKACVSFKEGSSATSEDIIQHCRTNLTGYKVPRVVEILDELPKTITGKIQRAALKEKS